MRTPKYLIHFNNKSPHSAHTTHSHAETIQTHSLTTPIPHLLIYRSSWYPHSGTTTNSRPIDPLFNIIHTSCVICIVVVGSIAQCTQAAQTIHLMRRLLTMNLVGAPLTNKARSKQTGRYKTDNNHHQVHKLKACT